VLTALSTENVSQRLQQEAGSSFTAMSAKLQASFDARIKNAQMRHQAQGFSKADSLSTLWNIYQKKAGTTFPQSEVFMTVSDAKVQEIKGKLQNSPFSAVPNLNFNVAKKTITFDSQTAKDLPPKRYSPLVFARDFTEADH